MKNSKKIISILLSVLLVISTISCIGFISAGAASGDIIYFEKPADWGDTIYVYYWDAPSGNPTWPGNAMTKVSGNIYSYTCKSTFKTLLFNDNGTNQTVDLKYPGNSYICKVGTTSTPNNYGNPCFAASFSKYTAGLGVSATPGGSDFLSPVKVTLNCSAATSATYSINGGADTAFTDGTVITIGTGDEKVGDKITLTVTATDGKDTKTETYTFTKTDSPVASSIVYFDNSKYNWEDVYLYAYGTKENAKWPGEKMQLDAKSGLYFTTFTSAFSNENIIVNNGKEEDLKEQFPENGGLNITKGQCKLLTSDNQWVDYGTPDGKPAGFAYVADKSQFDTDVINVKIGLKNAVKGTYQIDGGTVFPYTGETTVAVGQGLIGNHDTKLTLTATSEDGTTVSKTFTYTKVFEKTNASFSAESDGHTTPAIGGKYGTNPDLKLGKNKTITVDGKLDDWDSSMLIAQGVANDDPRVYMPSSLHEQPWDDYALYAAWDDDNLYFMWEMANVTRITSPSDDFAASDEARPWRNSIPQYLALSIDPTKSASGKAIGTDKTGNKFVNDYVWGCTGGAAKDGGVSFSTHIDTLIAFDTNNSNGGASIFKADVQDENGDWLFNYDTAIPIGVTSYEKQDNQNGFQVKHANGMLSDTLIGVNAPKGSNKMGETFKSSSNWVDFKELGYKNEHGFIYEVAVPLKNLGIDKSYIETNGIGAMHILTYGTSGMDCLPYDATMQDVANVEYSYDPSTSHEKEDIDTITVPLARVGALLPDTVINEAPFEVNFGADKSGTQGVNTQITLSAEAYNGSGDYSYKYSVDGVDLASPVWTPTEQKTYKIAVTVTDNTTGKTVSKELDYTIGDKPVVVETTPTSEPAPTSQPTPTTTDPIDTTPTPTSTNPIDTTPTPTSTDPFDTTPTPTSTDPIASTTVETNPVSTTAPIITEPLPTTATEPSEITPTPVKKTTVKVTSPKTMYVGRTATVKKSITNPVGTTTYSSSKKSVATIDKKGKITAKKAGTTYITVKNNKVSAKIKLKVKNPDVKAPKIIKLTKSAKITIKNAVGKVKFTALTKNIKLSKKTKTSVNVTAKKKGTAKIKVTSKGFKKTITIKIK